MNMKAHIQESESGLVLHLRKEQNPLKGVPSVIADEFMHSVEASWHDDLQQPVRRVLHLSEWMTPPWMAKDTEVTVWKTPKNAFGYPKAMLAKTVPLDLDDSDVVQQIKRWADETEAERWRLLESLGMSRVRLENSWKELNEYRSIGSVEHVRMLNNLFGRNGSIATMGCTRPFWHATTSKPCPCDNPVDERTCFDCDFMKMEIG